MLNVLLLLIIQIFNLYFNQLLFDFRLPIYNYLLQSLMLLLNYLLHTVLRNLKQWVVRFRVRKKVNNCHSLCKFLRFYIKKIFFWWRLKVQIKVVYLLF